MNVWPYVVVLVLFGLLLTLSVRNRRRAAAADAERSRRIGVGTKVMTTSGLYGTVVRRNEDDTVLLAIAPGVEVRWALAALRDASELSGRYAQGIGERGGTSAGPAGDAAGPAAGGSDTARRESGS
ncbi:MAG: preprotein translocase subunit YajC [Jatrophihabitans sp.]|nr:MAG: preprotein translocase subunit YajC [Jatrophihabitans sp.]